MNESLKGREERVRDLARSLRLSNLKNKTAELAREGEQMLPMEFLEYVLKQERDCRQQRACERRIREACLPQIRTLEEFDTSVLSPANQSRLERLSDLEWIGQKFNLVLSGPPGTGKTHLAIGLAYKAAQAGYPTSFIGITELVQLLRTSQLEERAKRRMQRIRDSKLLIIDGLDVFPGARQEVSLFMQLLSNLYEHCSVIITSCSGIEHWLDLFGEDSLIFPVLDRFMHRCEQMELKGKSYRMEHREQFFKES